VENWNDDRLDELSRRMDAGFDQVATKMEVSGVRGEVASAKEEMRGSFAKVDKEFDKVAREFGRVTDRLDKLFYGVGFIGLTLGLNLMAGKL
jgi:phage shock protein A